MSFCSVLRFPASNHQEKVSWTFSMEVLNIRRRDVWTVHGWLHLSWFGISGSSVKLIEIFCLIIGRTWIFQRPACSISYRFSIYNGIKTLFLILNICYEHTMIVWFLQKSYVNFIKPIFYFAVRKFVCTPQQSFLGVNTEYRANLVKDKGKCSNHFATHTTGGPDVVCVSE